MECLRGFADPRELRFPGGEDGIEPGPLADLAIEGVLIGAGGILRRGEALFELRPFGAQGLDV